MVECLLDSQNTGVRFPYRLPKMIIRGVGSHRNLKVNEKIQDGPSHNNIHPGPHNVGQAHIVTVDGIDYFMKRPDGPLMGDSYFNGINNQIIDIDGEFVGDIIIVNSWTKVGPSHGH